MATEMNDASAGERGGGLIEVQHRRRWTFREKLRAAQEASTPGTSVSSVARKYGMAPSQLFRWRKVILNGDREAVLTDGQAVLFAEVRELKRQVRDLERLLGKKTLENEILKEAIAEGKSKK